MPRTTWSSQKGVTMIQQLKQLALQAKQAADNSVKQRQYHRALEIMQQIVQQNVAAKQFEDYVKRLKDIDEIATPTLSKVAADVSRLHFLGLINISSGVDGANFCAQSADDFFHTGAQAYLTNNTASAREQVDKGLKLYPNDTKLKKLDELLKQQHSSNNNSNKKISSNSKTSRNRINRSPNKTSRNSRTKRNRTSRRNRINKSSSKLKNQTITTTSNRQKSNLPPAR